MHVTTGLDRRVGALRAAARLRDLVALRAFALVALVAVAFAVRFAALAAQGHATMEWDGANYARIAENLRDGVGNVSIRGVPNILHAPLYPLAMAGLMVFGLRAENAGIAVSLVAGALLVVPVFAIARALFDRRAATIAATIAALHPMLIAASTSVLSEQLFITLAFAGLALLLGELRRWSPLRWAACGLAFGGAYLTREEGLAGLAVALSALAVAAMTRRLAPRRAFAAAALTGAAFALCALPYAIFLSVVTGHARLEAKSALNYTISARVLAGMSYAQAANGLDPSGREVGLELGASWPFNGIPVHEPRLAERLRLAAHAAPLQTATLLHAFGARSAGTPLLPVFAFAGVVLGAASRRRALHAIVIALAASSFAALLTVLFFWARFAYVFAPYEALYAGAALAALTGRFALTPGMRRGVGAAAAVAAALWIAAGDAVLRRDAVDPIGFRRAGAWIATRSPHALVMSVDDLTAYYAGARWCALPYADDAAARLYVGARRPPFVVLDTAYADRPYLPTWLAGGVGAGYRRAFATRAPNGGVVVVFAAAQ